MNEMIIGFGAIHEFWSERPAPCPRCSYAIKITEKEQCPKCGYSLSEAEQAALVEEATKIIRHNTILGLFLFIAFIGVVLWLV